ncbi:MAG: GH3 auxin-responsive promoter family protein, partial [Myxococcota bacterium]
MGFRHALFSWVNRRLVRRTEWAWRHPAEAQRTMLSAILATHRGAGYLRHHGVDGDCDPRELAAALPIVRYEDLRPWVQPLVDHGSGAAETTVHQPVTLFLKTSGTTGPAKLLPVTDAYEAEADRGRAIWIRAMLAENDLNGDGSHLSVISPREESRTPGGLLCGSNTGRIFRRQLGFVQFFAPVPYEVFSLKDFDLRY